MTPDPVQVQRQGRVVPEQCGDGDVTSRQTLPGLFEVHEWSPSFFGMVQRTEVNLNPRPSLTWITRMDRMNKIV